MSDLVGENPFPPFRFLTQRGIHTEDRREGWHSIMSKGQASRPLRRSLFIPR